MRVPHFWPKLPEVGFWRDPYSTRHNAPRAPHTRSPSQNRKLGVPHFWPKLPEVGFWREPYSTRHNAPRVPQTSSPCQNRNEGAPLLAEVARSGDFALNPTQPGTHAPRHSDKDTSAP